MNTLTVSRVLIVCALICFVLAIFDVPMDAHKMVALGLALFASGHLV